MLTEAGGICVANSGNACIVDGQDNCESAMFFLCWVRYFFLRTTVVLGLMLVSAPSALNLGWK